MNVLIIGKGIRVKKTLLISLQKKFNNIYLYSKNQKEAAIFCENNDIKHLSNLKKIDDSIKFIFIATPSLHYSTILREIKNLNKKTIYLDTPIIGPLKNISILKYSKSKIHVTEDWISKPFFFKIKNFLKENNFEKIEKIHFNHSGYSYHALAVAKSIVMPRFFFFMFCAKFRNNYYIRINNVRINIINPRNYSNCYTYIETTNYLLIDNNSSNKIHKFNNNKKILYFSRSGKNLNHSSYSFNIKDNSSKKINDSYENEDKIFSILQKIDNNEKQYLLIDGIYDSFVISFVEKFNFFIDIGIYKNTITRIIIRWLKYLM